MATGDTVISIAIEGGVTKSVTLDSATRVLSRTFVSANYVGPRDADIDTDAKWQVFEINNLADVLLAEANGQAQSAASWTRKTFTAAS